MSGLKRIIKLLQNGQSVVIFPEGARSTDGKLQPGQPGAGLVAAKAGVPILPVRLFGTYESLPPSSSKLHFHPVRVVIGKPFLPPADARTSKDKDLYAKLGQRMMDEIAALG